MAASALVDSSTHGFSVANNSAFYGTTAFTASGWFKLTSDPSDYGYFFGNNNGPTKGWVVYASTGSGGNNLKPSTSVSDGTDSVNSPDTTAQTANTWIFVAFTYDGSNIRYYRGTETEIPILIATTAQAGSMGSGPETLTFGSLSSDATFRNLQVSDCRIYNATVRTLGQIQSDYKKRLTGSETGLTDYWKFNDGSGNTAVNSTSARNATASTASWVADEPSFTNNYSFEKHIDLSFGTGEGIGTISTTSASYVETAAPTYVNIDVSKYTGYTIYFEAMLKTSAATAYAQLYKTDGSAISGSEVTTTATSGTLVRSAAITLTGSDTYTVRIKNDGSNTTTYYSARVVIVQSAVTITATESQIPLTTSDTDTTSTSYENFGTIYFGRFLYTAANWNGTLTVYFEATAKNAGANTTSIELYDETAAAAVASSAVTTTSTSYVKLRSSAITLVDGHTYFARRKTSAGTGAIADARIIIQQSNSPTKTESHLTLVKATWTKATTGGSFSSTVQAVTYTSTNWSGLTSNNWYHQINIHTNNAVSLNDLYSVTSAATVTTSQIDVGDNGSVLTRYRTAALTMPVSQNILPRDKTDGTNYIALDSLIALVVWVNGSPSASLSVSPTPSTSVSSSVSPSPSASISPSSSISPSPSVSVSLSPSASVSPSSSASASLSLTGSPSPSLSPSVTPSISVSLSQSLSPSVSVSQSPSLSISLTPSPSPSLTASASPSLSPSLSFSLSASTTPSTSGSRSLSPSASSSPSISVSRSPSISVSPSLGPPGNIYTREATVALPSTHDHLATEYTTAEENEVYDVDSETVCLSGAASRYLIHQFQRLNDNVTDYIKIKVDITSTLAPSSKTIYLQLWNHRTEAWVTIDSNSTKEANEAVALYALINTTPEVYYDFGNHVTARVYQQNDAVGTQTLCVERAAITFQMPYADKYTSATSVYTPKYPHKNSQDDIGD